MNVSFDMNVASPLWEPEEQWRTLVERALDACTKDAGADWPSREVSILLCDDAEIRTLNHQWRGFDKPTNVLSFPAPGEHEDMPLGDIAVAFETCEREARADGKTFDDHVTHLVVHGVLHLLGYDHETESEAEEMEDTERRILRTLGISDPYATSAEAIR